MEQDIKKFAQLIMIELFISMILGFSSFNLKLFLMQIVLIIFNFVFLNKLSMEEPSAIIIGVIESIIGIVAGNIFNDIPALVSFGVLIGSIIVFFIGDKIGILEAGWFRFLSNVAIVAAVFLMIVVIALNKSGVTTNVKKLNIKEDFASLEKDNTLEEIEKKLNKKGEEKPQYYEDFKEYEFNYSSAKGIKITTTLDDGKLWYKSIECDSDIIGELFGEQKVTFKDVSSLKTISDNNEILKFEDFKNNIVSGANGELISVYYRISGNEEKYIFSDETGESYLKVTIDCEKNFVSDIEGSVNGDYISLRFTIFEKNY